MSIIHLLQVDLELTGPASVAAPETVSIGSALLPRYRSPGTPGAIPISPAAHSPAVCEPTPTLTGGEPYSATPVRTTAASLTPGPSPRPSGCWAPV